MTKKIMEFQGEDNWGRMVFKDENKRIWKDVDGKFYSTTKEGEPDCPIKKGIKITVTTKYDKEIEKWKKKPINKERYGLTGYPKIPITAIQYTNFRNEGETPELLFGQHKISKKVKK